MKKIILTVSAFLMLGTMSCKDEFLEVSPLGVLSEANLTNADGVNLVLTGAYSLLDGVQTNVNSPFPDWTGSADNWVYGSVAADDAYKGTNAGDQPEISLIETFTHTSDLTHFRGKWRAVYDGVARSNDVIQLVAKATGMTDTEKNLVRAQARFLRGHYHFEGRKMFNKIPYIDEVSYNAGEWFGLTYFSENLFMPHRIEIRAAVEQTRGTRFFDNQIVRYYLLQISITLHSIEDSVLSMVINFFFSILLTQYPRLCYLFTKVLDTATGLAKFNKTLTKQKEIVNKLLIISVVCLQCPKRTSILFHKKTM